MKNINKELRNLTNGQFEIRTVNGKPTVSGYAVVYGQRSVDLGGFTEILSAGCLRDSLKSTPVRLLAQHDWSQPLATTSNGTLTLRDSQYGLGFDATFPATSYANDIIE